MAITRGTPVRQDSVEQGRGPATRGFRKHSVAVAMLLLIGVQGSAMAASDGSPAAQTEQVAVRTDVSAAGAAAASTLEKDAGLIGVLATEIACGAMLLVGLRRYSADRRARQY